MEEKLDKKEKDFNRLNLNYAKMINKSKRQDNNSNEELIEKLEKVREENKKLKNTINCSPSKSSSIKDNPINCCSDLYLFIVFFKVSISSFFG